MRRRRDQGKLTDLGLVARFLNHCASERGLTQAAIADRLDNASISTVSRWFRGAAVPTDHDLRALAELFELPFSVMLTLGSFERAGRRQHMLSTLSAWFHMAINPGPFLVIAGLTMSPAVVILRAAELDGVRVFVSLLDPARGAEGAPSAIGALEAELGPASHGSLYAPWLASVTILRSLLGGAGAKGRLWGRRTPHLGLSGAPDYVEMIANRWIAICSRDPREQCAPDIFFSHSDEWRAVVQPYLNRLAGRDEDAGDGHRLLWDTAWSPDDPRRDRLRVRLQAAHAALAPELLVPG